MVAIQDSGANPGPFRHRGPIRAHSSGCRAAGCEDGIPGAMSCRPIDKFAENVSTAKEVSPLSNHMDQNLMQGGMAPLTNVEACGNAMNSHGLYGEVVHVCDPRHRAYFNDVETQARGAQLSTGYRTGLRCPEQQWRDHGGRNGGQA